MSSRDALSIAVRAYIATRRKTSFTPRMCVAALPTFNQRSVRAHLCLLASKGRLLCLPKAPGRNHHTYQEAEAHGRGRVSGKLVMSDELIAAVMSLPVSQHEYMDLR